MLADTRFVHSLTATKPPVVEGVQVQITYLIHLATRQSFPKIATLNG